MSYKIMSVTGEVLGFMSDDVYISGIKKDHSNYTDDQILDIAIEMAKAKGGLTKIIYDGEDIRYAGNITHVCKGFGGIDFNGSKVYMPNYDAGTIISIEPDASETITVNASDIYENKVTDSRLLNKVFALNSNTAGNDGMCLGHRTGNHEESVYWTPTVITSPDGEFITGGLYLVPTSGDVACQNVHEYPDTIFEVSNGTIISSSGANMSVLIRSTRSNVHLHNFVLSGGSGVASFHYGIFLLKYCAGIEIDNIVGINPVRLPVSGYGIALYSVTNVHVHDCAIGDSRSWGAIGSNHLINTVFERCALNRWDCHYAQCGYNVIRECVLSEIAYGVGNGILSIEKCLLQPDASSENDINLIYLRPDLVGAFDGDIIVRDCTFRTGDQAKSKLNIWKDGCVFAKPSDSAIDWISERKRIIDNCVFPDGCNRVFIVGSTEAGNQDIFSRMTYSVKNSVLDCADSIIDSINSIQTTVKGIVVENCTVKTQCYVTKALINSAVDVGGCDFGTLTARVVSNTILLNIWNSMLSAIVSDSASQKLVANGNTFSGTQSVSNFSAYALSGNIASDMASVNKHS